MKTKLIGKSIILLAVLVAASTVFIGCQSMDDAKHNDEDGRDGVSGYALTLQINPSRVPANNNATMEARVRFVRLKDMAPVSNTRIRLMIMSASYDYLDPYIVSFADNTLLTDVVTNAAGEASVTMYVGDLGRAIPELMYSLDVQGTVEYEKWNTLIYHALEAFYIYNPHWDGRLPPDKITPTAVIFRTPAGDVESGVNVEFFGGQSYDRGQTASAETWNHDKAYSEIVEYRWDFGDGTSGTGATVNHKFTNSTSGPKTYEVQLRVKDDEGFFGFATEAVTVIPPETP